MYEFECLTQNENEKEVNMDACGPFWGECYPIAEGLES